MIKCKILVKVEATGPCRKVLTIQIPAESVAEEYAKVAQDSVKAASIHGFRKGKAPQAMVQRRYAKEIEGKVKEYLISRSYQEALQKEQINPVAVLDLKEVTIGKDQPMSYKVVLDVPPDFKLPRYKGIALKDNNNNIEVSDEDVQQRLEQLKDRLAKYEDVKDRAIRKGDLVQIDYTGNCEGKLLSDVEKNSPRLGQGTDFWTAADENAFLPGFDTGLLGMTVGDEKDIQVDFPADFRAETVAGKKAVYHVTVKGVREKQCPEIDSDFFKQFGVDSETALRAKLRESLLAEANHREKERLKKEITEMLLNKTSFDLPESLVQDETRHMFSSMVRETLQRGVTREQVDGQKEQLLNVATKSAGEKVKLGYILHRIADEEEIKVDDEETNRFIQQLGSYYRMAPDALKKELEEKKEIDSIRHEVRMNKTLDFLLENAKIGKTNFLGRVIGGRKEK